MDRIVGSWPACGHAHVAHTAHAGATSGGTGGAGRTGGRETGVGGADAPAGALVGGGDCVAGSVAGDGPHAAEPPTQPDGARAVLACPAADGRLAGLLAGVVRTSL